MMDELLKRVTEKTGLSEEQARSAVQTVMAFLKERLPAQYASTLESVVGGAGTTEGLTAKAGDVLGGLFGKKG